MLLLTSTSDKIQVITSGTPDIDVHASYMDYDGSAVTPGRKNTKITTATTTDVVLAPVASTTRNVKALHVANVHATTANTVTIQHTDGTTVVELEKVTLLAGERISYREGVGMRVIDINGVEKAPGLTAVYNASTADQVTGTSDVYLLGSDLLIGGRLKPGSMFRWRLVMTKTAAGTANPVIIVRFGTAGAIGDTARNTLTTTVAGSAAVDTAVWNVYAIVRAHSATVGVVQAGCGLMHALDSTGFVGGNGSAQATSGTFDTTVAGLKVGLSYNGGASAAHTVQQVQSEALNLAA